MIDSASLLERCASLRADGLGLGEIYAWLQAEAPADAGRLWWAFLAAEDASET